MDLSLSLARSHSYFLPNFSRTIPTSHLGRTHLQYCFMLPRVLELLSLARLPCVCINWSAIPAQKKSTTKRLSIRVLAGFFLKIQLKPKDVLTNMCSHRLSLIKYTCNFLQFKRGTKMSPLMQNSVQKFSSFKNAQARKWYGENRPFHRLASSSIR